MPRIVNPFSGESPIASALNQFGQSMFGGQLDRMLNSERLIALQRGNQETLNLMNQVAENGARNLPNDPITQAMIIGAGYDPSNFAELGLLDAATEFGARDPRTQNFQVGSGQSYSTTADAFDANLAETRRQFDMSPEEIFRDGQPLIVPRSESYGERPIMSSTDAQGSLLFDNFENLEDLTGTQLDAIGAGPTARTPRNYRAPNGQVFITYDGATDAQTGQALPPGGYMASVEGGAEDTGLTNAVQTDVQSKALAVPPFIDTIDRLWALTENPANFGLPGMVRGLSQEVVEAARATLNLMGGEGGAEAIINQTRGEIEQDGLAYLIPEMYDPELPEIDTLFGIMVYQGASVLAGQENRSISDKDVQFMRQILGDPKALFSSAENVRAKLRIIRGIAERSYNRNVETLEGGGTGQPLPPAPWANTPPANTNAPGQEWVDPTNGNRVVIVGQ